MSNWRKHLFLAVLTASAVGANAQFLAEQNAAMGGMDTLNSAPVGGVPGAVGGPGNLAGGLSPAGQMGAPMMPGDPTMGMGMGMGMGMSPGMTGMPGAMGQPAAAPVATQQVLVGKRVYDAVNGGLLEDAMLIQVEASAVTDENYPDDGINDNGIAGDGIRGKVETSRNEYIGTISNNVKNQLINLVQNADDIPVMTFYGYHIATIGQEDKTRIHIQGDRMQVDRKVIGPGSTESGIPNYLDIETSKDELLRDWNNKFLASYRVNPNDPQSEFFQVYIPEPPMVPQNYPLPPGYVTPQAVANQQRQAAEQAVMQQSMDVMSDPTLGGPMNSGGNI